MTGQRYVHDILQTRCHLYNGSQEQFFNKTREWCHKNVSALLLPFLGLPVPSFVSNRAYLGSFGMVSWASPEFERTLGKVTANMERNVSIHHTELVCLNA
ncbi:uncharacterized protein TNCV_195151 [Trichonephila clavipes]|uniref:Uncharacterized protein n=1 Tax=Trichonephila clavipes TaxID=2585209 RepID=A0A8X6WHX9_TRICX|nr:uncharacterized protein TNCV_195151 [Trichonephila clavipes]